MTARPSGYCSRLIPLLSAITLLFVLTAQTLAAPVSRCIALAQSIPGVHYASLTNAALTRSEVRITFVGHSTFRLESSGGVILATDYTGAAGPGPIPTVVTMNHAHSSHYTDFPDPRIEHVLRGWGTEGEPAKHNLKVGDVLVRNVTTDIRGYGGVREQDGNSIFIFEVADLCIGHLGHLHHPLGPDYLGLIGQLDVVMVPVDGTYTMNQAAMAEVLKLLKARLILPMHYFSEFTLSNFLSKMGEGFDVDVSETASVTVSFATLPKQPTVLALPRVSLVSPAE